MIKDKINNLAMTHPEIAVQWHPTKNIGLMNKKGEDVSTPDKVTAGSGLKVWWLLPYDIPMDYPVEHLRGKHFDFEWEATISNRTNGKGCPFLAQNPAVWNGFNDLETVVPELAAQWHPTKNKELRDKNDRDISTPDKVTANSMHKVWWLLPYDVPMDYPVAHLRGKHFDFEWESVINNRTKGIGCPFLSNQAVWKGFNDLETINPDIAKEWHFNKNIGLKNKKGEDISTPDKVSVAANQKVWWRLPYDVPMDYPIEHLRGKHFDFEWESVINNRTKGIGCPYLSDPAKSVWIGFNDLATTHPELSKEWHPIKNGNLQPTDVTAGSDRKVWWFLPYDVPMNCPIAHLRGKHFDFEWKSTVSDRIKGKCCPFLSGKTVWTGFNDLATTHPELAKQWHPIKNKKLSLTAVTAGANKEAWWFLPYDVPMDYPIKHLRGQHFDFEWKTTLNSRTSKGSGCPFLSVPAKSIWVGFNDLATTHPELAKEWHPTKNGKLTPEMVSAGCNKKIWWYLSHYDVKTASHQNYEWEAVLSNRTTLGRGCPFIVSSKGEEAVRKILKSKNIIFEEQYKFKDRFFASDKHPLRDDFAIFDKHGNVITTIEFNGQQHYEPVDFAGQGKANAKRKFMELQKRDKIKSDYLKKHGIYQLIVPYWEFDNVEEIVKKFIDELSKNHNL